MPTGHYVLMAHFIYGCHLYVDCSIGTSGEARAESAACVAHQLRRRKPRGIRRRNYARVAYLLTLYLLACAC